MYTLNVAEFQSTHPVRGATDYAGSAPVGRRVSIHAPREGCDGDVRWWRDHAGVSIHAPREGCDALPRYVFWRNAGFQSTHPVRGATWSAPTRRPCSWFQSTHPVRGATWEVSGYPSRDAFQSTHPVRGATRRVSAVVEYADKFQSTHPVRGATFISARTTIRFMTFQSTHPVRGATGHGNRRDNRRVVSIHAPREGCDSWSVPRRRWTTRFNPRTP